VLEGCPPLPGRDDSVAWAGRNDRFGVARCAGHRPAVV